MKKASWRWLPHALGVGFLSMAPLLCAEDLLSSRLLESERYIEVVPAGDSKATGRLPLGCRDQSWSPSTHVSYGPRQENGHSFLRMEVSALVYDPAQMAFSPLPALPKGEWLRLTFKCRASGNTETPIVVKLSTDRGGNDWSTEYRLSSEWAEYHAELRLGKPLENGALYFCVRDTAVVDLAEVKLTRLAPNYSPKLPGEKPMQPGVMNLLRNSRLPLGLQSGWVFREKSDKTQIEAGAAVDPDVIGPSGFPVLCVKSKEGGFLTTEPFGVGESLNPITASFYVRGAAGAAEIIADRKEIGLSRFPPGKEWHRVQVTAEPKPGTKAYGLQVLTSGQIWLDAFQVESGTAATPYRSGGRYEVALACGTGTASADRILFEDEPAKVRYCITGTENPDGAKLRARVVNAFADTKDLEPIRLGRNSPLTGEIGFNCFPRRPLGSFRVEAWVEDQSGARISPYNEIVVHRLHRPRYWEKDAPDSPFGIHARSTAQQLSKAKAVGINWVRLHDAGLPNIGWFYLEPERGKWCFRDTEIKRYREHNLMILGELASAPKWASHFQDAGEAHLSYDKYYQPKDLPAFANYVKTVVERYNGVIDYWDIWNEPWDQRWWAIGFESKQESSWSQGYLKDPLAEAHFARLMHVAYDAAKAVNPRACILGFNTSWAPLQQSWTKAVAEAGGLAWCDAIAYHQYTYRRMGYPGDPGEFGYKNVVSELGNSGGKSIWMTEGSPFFDDTELIKSGLYHHTLPYEESEDVLACSDRMGRFVVSQLSQGVAKIFLYSMDCQSYFPSSEFAVLVTPEGQLHPSGAALSAITWMLEDTRFHQRVALAEGVTAYLFAGAHRSVAVLSAQSRHCQYYLPTEQRLGGIKAYDLFGNPIHPGVKLGATLVYLVSEKPISNLRSILSPSTKTDAIIQP